MGDEATCFAEYRGARSAGKAHLDGNELRFRGEFKLAISLREVSSVEAAAGLLRLTFGDQTASLEIGKQAERWARKIREPRQRIDKLDVKSTSVVSLLKVTDPTLQAEVSGRAQAVSLGALAPQSDIVFYEMESGADMVRLPELRESIKKTGAIWVIWPKGLRDLRDIEVMAAAREAGLVDTKVVGFSSSHTALKLVIPRDQR